jgi:hypothetical protein
VNGTGENLRMFRVGPQSERGGMIAWAAVPLAPHAPVRVLSTEAVQRAVRVNITCVTPLGEEVASTW